MAIYHCNIKIISRGKGRSAVAASAYRSGETLTNDYDGVTHDFTRKRGIVHTEILLPSHAPPGFADRSVLWNSVEKVEKSKNSQLAREIEVAVPIELSREKQIQLVRDYALDNFVSAGMCADIAIHDKGDGNPHAHIMLTMRPITESGEWGAKSKKEYILDEKGQRIKQKNGGFKSRKIDTVDWNNKENAELWRKAWADCVNRFLEEQDIHEKVDHRSYERQGIEQIPTIHVGVAATQMERRGVMTEKGERNRQIKEINQLIKEIHKKLAILAGWVKTLNGRRTKEEQNRDVCENSLTLLELLDKAIRQSGRSNSRYGKIKDLKNYATAVSFLQKNRIDSFSGLQETVSKMNSRYWDSISQIKRIEKAIHEKEELIEEAENYLKYKKYYEALKKTKPRKQADYKERYRMELDLYAGAERYLKKYIKDGIGAMLKYWKADMLSLNSKKNSLYIEMRKLRVEVSEAEAVKNCVERIIKQNNQVAEHKKDRDMEL